VVSAYIACWGGITLTVTRIAMIEMSVGWRGAAFDGAPSLVGVGDVATAR
jgi:hypothetical protein